MDLTKLLNKNNGENYALMNTIYHRSKRLDDGTYSDDAISLILKDLDTGDKENILIENPNLETYVVKPHIETNPLMKYIVMERDKLDKVEINYKMRVRDTAKIIGKDAEMFYWNCLKNKNSQALDEIKKWNRIFSSDWDIEDFYRYKCLDHFGIKEKIPLTKGFLDIEADLYNHNLDLKTVTGDAPINAVTIIDDNAQISYTLLLRDETNPQIDELEKDMDNFIKELNDDFDDEFGKFKYNVIFYDKEIDLLKDLFIIINTLKLDFILIWNMSFDIQYIIHRIKELGYNPDDIICDPTFKYKECYYHSDTRNKKIKLKTDYFRSSTYSTFICQMITYGAVRSAQKELDSYKLDFIGGREVQSTKLDYSEYKATIKTLPRVNYRVFAKYNIRDVLVQVKIERKVRDVELMYQLSYDSATRTNKAFKKSIFLRNIAFMFFKEQGFILGNNFNLFNEDSEENKTKFEGAVVGDPALNSYKGIILHHKSQIAKYIKDGKNGFKLRSKSVYENVQDYDYGALYPTIIMLFNIFINTQFGKVYLDGKNITDREVVLDYTTYDRSGNFIDDLELNEAILMLYRWFNIPTAESIIDDFRENKLRNLELTRDIDTDIRQLNLKRVIGGC